MTISTSLRETILTQLREGHWKAGDRLPTERELAEGYRVSRTTVRRALADLKQQGLIEQTVGSGTFVAQQAPSSLDRLPPPIVFSLSSVTSSSDVEVTPYATPRDSADSKSSRTWKSTPSLISSSACTRSKARASTLTSGNSPRTSSAMRV